MNRKSVSFIAALLAGSVVATYALAAGDACLANNRIQSTKVLDNSTIQVLTLDKKTYTVHMRGTCIGLDNTSEKLSFRTKTELGCLSRGDTVSYNRPGESTNVTTRGSLQTPCVVDSVSGG